MGAAAIAIAACCWMSFAAATGIGNGTIYFMGVAKSEPLPTDYGTVSLPSLDPANKFAVLQHMAARPNNSRFIAALAC